MNLVESYVLAVRGEPVHRVRDWGEYWAVDVRASCYGREYDTTITAKTEAEIRAVKVGYTWLT